MNKSTNQTIINSTEREELIKNILLTGMQFTPDYKKNYISEPASTFKTKISTQEFICFNIIAKKEQLFLSDLSQITSISLQQLSRIVSSLIKKELISRLTCENNRRKAILILTEKGKKEYNDFTNKIGLCCTNHLEKLTTEELKSCLYHMNELYKLFAKIY